MPKENRLVRGMPPHLECEPANGGPRKIIVSGNVAPNETIAAGEPDATDALNPPPPSRLQQDPRPTTKALELQQASNSDAATRGKAKTAAVLTQILGELEEMKKRGAKREEELRAMKNREAKREEEMKAMKKQERGGRERLTQSANPAVPHTLSPGAAIRTCGCSKKDLHGRNQTNKRLGMEKKRKRGKRSERGEITNRVGNIRSI